MSWSVSFVGTIDAISRALESYGDSLTGQSQFEFKEAQPHLDALLKQNVNHVGAFSLSANGHGTFTNGVRTHGYVSVRMEPAAGTIVT